MRVKKGFTLIELLVVISIIAVLATLSLVAVSGTQKQSRDTKRRSDLSQYRVALENYYTTYGSYPAMAYGVANTAGGALATALQTNFMGGTMLADPKATATCVLSGTDYNYCYYGSLTDYVITARLESGICFQVCGMANSTLTGGRAGNVACAASHTTCIVP